jgi:predicted transcriptional regulator
MTAMTIKLDKPELKYLKILAKRNGKKSEVYAREVLEDFLENDALVKLADQRMKDWEADGFRTYSWEDIKAENGL